VKQHCLGESPGSNCLGEAFSDCVMTV
jgi:hypothetical protein